MNNYFGIGLDAKIALEFHNKREESDKVFFQTILKFKKQRFGNFDVAMKKRQIFSLKTDTAEERLIVKNPDPKSLEVVSVVRYAGREGIGAPDVSKFGAKDQTRM